MHVESVDTYVQDVIHHVELMKKEYPGLPCILLGHSMASVCLCKMAMQLYKSMLTCKRITKGTTLYVPLTIVSFIVIC